MSNQLQLLINSGSRLFTGRNFVPGNKIEKRAIGGLMTGFDPKYEFKTNQQPAKQPKSRVTMPEVISDNRGGSFEPDFDIEYAQQVDAARHQNLQNALFRWHDPKTTNQVYDRLNALRPRPTRARPTGTGPNDAYIRPPGMMPVNAYQRKEDQERFLNLFR